MVAAQLFDGRGGNPSPAFLSLVFLSLAFLIACAPPVEYDLLISNGTVYDGHGGPPRSEKPTSTS